MKRFVRNAVREIFLAIILIGWCVGAKADTRNWKPATIGDWNDPACWMEEAVPGDGDTVFITNAGAGVTLSEATSNLLAITISRTVTFTNWTTQLRATTVTLQSGALLKLPPAFTETQMSNRVHIVCSDLSMEQGSAINADFCGYTKNTGPGKGGQDINYASGAGHAGPGGTSSYAFGGATYGSLEAPTLPGSGGGLKAAGLGSEGGGAIRIEASGTVSINGTVTANGGSSLSWSGNGGGAGGSIFITCQTFTGQQKGKVLVMGGGGGSPYNGGGSGGRIAIVYTGASFADGFALNGTPGIGIGNETLGQFFFKAARGTIYLSDNSILSETLGNNRFTQIDLHIADFTQWTVSSLTVTNCSVFLANDGLQLNVAGDLTIGKNGHLGIGKFSGTSVSKLNCGGNLYVTNSGALSVFSGLTNGVDRYGARVDVGGDMTVATSGWVYPYSHTNTGASVKFQMNNLWITRNASGSMTNGFNANGKGFGATQGPGAGQTASEYGGGGYGGKGGGGSQSKLGGNPYGSMYAPVQPGSGGSTSRGGHGGGLIWIEAVQTVLCNGELNAGGASGSNWHSGGGAGGGIFVTARTLSGDAYSLLAVPGANAVPVGSNSGGGGGGGRIAVWYGKPMPEEAADMLLSGLPPNSTIFNVSTTLASFDGPINIAEGTSYKYAPAEPGSIVFLKYQQNATLISVR